MNAARRVAKTLAARSVYIDGVQWYSPSSVEKNNDVGKDFWFNVTVENVLCEDSGGCEGLAVYPGDTVAPSECPECNDSPVTIINSSGSYNEIASPGSVHNLPDIEVTQANGDIDVVPSVVDVVCEFPVLELRNSDGTLLSTISSMPIGGIITAPDVTVNRDGSFYADAPAGTTQNVISAGVIPSGILYKRPHVKQKTSYRNGDTGWHCQNGSHAWSNPANPAVIQDLDYTVPAADFWYTLKFNNVFGNKYRFTNSVGVQASDGRANFVTYTTGGGIDRYVIDHLTGLGYYVPNLGNLTWNSYIDLVFGYFTGGFIGFTGWQPCMHSQLIDLLSLGGSYYSTANIFRRGLVSGYPETRQWTGETVETSTTSAYSQLDGYGLSSNTKATLSPMSGYMWRIHY